MNGRRSRSVRASGMAEGVAAAVRRRQRERQPRVMLYDRSGAALALAPASPGYDDLLEIGEAMVALAVASPADPPGDARPRAAGQRARRSRAERGR